MGSSSRRATLRRDGFRALLALLAVMWVSEIVDTALDHRLDGYGIEPRDADGLIGIPAAPFLHAGFGHLISNTVPFLAMGFVIAFRGAVTGALRHGDRRARERGRHVAGGARSPRSTSARAGWCSATPRTC
ncbi:MAG: hypothetical protein WKF40_07860 [Thermoleophilaceae bacterium]